ncbi:hypothetical protein PV327_000913 [Microctonus hyperodae]|uniref:Uncharacterized protein n=1 Tax=Microctonus hyperodae TaxID=165561 RepID=A0AA39L2S6_MICHY|nr:hypothetical protein PV327_000913 [Microctonus hyperodae]
MSDTVPKDRMMKYPYTLTAKIIAFPYKYYYKFAWFPKFWLAGIALTIPVFWKIGKMVNSPENVEQWRETRRKQLEEHH